MKMKKASEFMIPLEAYPHVPYWFSIRQAVAIMERAEVGSEGRSGSIGARFVLVFNESYKLLGTIRRRDIFRALRPSCVAGPEEKQAEVLSAVNHGPKETSSSDSLVSDILTQAERPISDVMQPIQSTVDHEDHLLQVMSKMIEENASMLPVLRDGVVIGVVRSVEVFQEVATLIQ
jgi:CBS domain-containing protein